eukprot:TRINITY_DN954_c0_g1::TRINITY_DN954_c0_g1_i1::g.15922::m.15922 TRINITY_DN954_c0_g1::TRINITY_DN954_c0_g1_i1::g.15922  ORF type:complete len:264 (-),score=66.91,sp/O88587/COMT_MOUSE/48.42/1e-72,Methyltransf_3/PF01596.12/1.8e-23,Methyltransf_24/PF13578.1/2.1e-12,Methyltransf_18/PF12847.2/0.00033,Methyltransf_26/PF13659.1/0.0078,Methyltransf_15/PF09445.5/0.087,Methyltransf_31/PF13847.1/0.09 TRINITY_DN954_c0_g1_i1:47-838(-)
MGVRMLVFAVVCLTAAYFIQQDPALFKLFSKIAAQRLSNFARGTKTEEKVLRYVFENAKEGDPESVMSAIDHFGSTQDWMMNVGDVKGQIVDSALRNATPAISLELGTYCGYSAVRNGRLLPAGSKYYSIDIDPFHAAIATKIIEFAGLGDKVKSIVGNPQTVLTEFKTKFGVDSFDFVFIDHDKASYLPDLQLLEKLGLLHEGTVVVADNILFPGAPEYALYVRNSPDFESKFYLSELEFSDGVQDGVEVSVYKPAATTKSA